MFIRIVHHWAKPGQTEDGRRFIDENGVKMEKAPGFKYRYRLEPPEGPTIITTLTAWDYRGVTTRHSVPPRRPIREVPTLPVRADRGSEIHRPGEQHGALPAYGARSRRLFR